MYHNSRVHYITKLMVDILFYAGIICVLAIPFLSRQISGFYGYRELRPVLPVMAVLFTSGCLAIYILFLLKRMFRTLLGGNPFVEVNVGCLRRMAVACGGIALIYFLKCAVMFSYATVIIVLVFSVGCLFCLTLKDIFKQAIAYKEENDLTI